MQPLNTLKRAPGQARLFSRLRSYNRVSLCQSQTSLGYRSRRCGCVSMSERAQSSAPLVLVIMGVSGCGKSTVGAILAARLECPFYDADNYHPPVNIRKMSSGIPLTDEDRWHWLQRLADLIAQHVQQNSHAVLACSALKPAYRRVLLGTAHLASEQQAAVAAVAIPATRTEQGTGELQGVPGSKPAVQAGNTTAAGQQLHQCQQQPQSPIAFVLLNPSKAELLERVRQRASTDKHFMPPSLLEDQLRQLSYDPEELYMCFGGTHGSDETARRSKHNGQDGDSTCSHGAVAQQQQVVGADVEDNRIGARMPTTEQIVAAILHRMANG